MIKSSKLKGLWANDHFAATFCLLLVCITITVMVLWPVLWLVVAGAGTLGGAYWLVYSIVKSVRDGTFLK